MAVADYHVRRIARSHCERHGAEAIGKARERVRELIRRGDSIGADMWIRIIILLNDWRLRHDVPSTSAE
jgi:hypothetical protein